MNVLAAAKHPPPWCCVVVSAGRAASILLPQTSGSLISLGTLDWKNASPASRCRLFLAAAAAVAT